MIKFHKMVGNINAGFTVVQGLKKTEKESEMYEKLTQAHFAF